MVNSLLAPNLLMNGGQGHNGFKNCSRYFRFLERPARAAALLVVNIKVPGHGLVI
jgi:hypothetical protein